MNKTSDYIFVYGTLRGESQSGAHKEYLQNSDFVANAKIRGQLFLVDYYPGVVQLETTNGQDYKSQQWVVGEIYILQNQKLLHQIDIYEGCAPQSPQPHEYKRELVNAILPNDEMLEAWTYIYTGDTKSLPIIRSGDFLQQSKEIDQYVI